MSNEALLLVSDIVLQNKKGVTCLHLIRLAFSAILIQIVMVSPGTHVVKNFESLSITTNESDFRKTRRPKLK